MKYKIKTNNSFTNLLKKKCNHHFYMLNDRYYKIEHVFQGKIQNNNGFLVKMGYDEFPNLNLLFSRIKNSIINITIEKIEYDSILQMYEKLDEKLMLKVYSKLKDQSKRNFKLNLKRVTDENISADDL